MKKLAFATWLVAGCCLLNGCSMIQPPSVSIEETPPYEEVTLFSDALFELGRMSVIYNAPPTKIQYTQVGDETGASHPLATGGEIQRDISEIVKSTLNSIGGKVSFIEYNPDYVINQITTGYSKFEKRAIPDIVVTGGITGFDRALETVSAGKDYSADLQFPDIQNEGDDVLFPPSELIAGAYSNSRKKGIARITVDFNLKNYETLMGLPYMTTTNSIKVQKGLNEKDLSITVFGPSFGMKGNSTKVQGRHQAVRLLVQSSMIHLVGRYMALPYWRLLGAEAEPDKFVLMQLQNTYNRLDEFDRMVKAQLWLLVHGYSLDVTGEMDEKTKQVLAEFDDSFNPEIPALTWPIFKEIYVTMPLTEDAFQRRVAINQLLAKN